MNSYLYLRSNPTYGYYYNINTTYDLKKTETEFYQNEMQKGHFEFVYKFPFDFALTFKNTIHKRYKQYNQKNTNFFRKDIIHHIDKLLQEKNEIYIKFNKSDIKKMIYKKTYN